MRRSSRDVSDSVQRQSGGFQLCNREQIPQVQFQSVTQKQIPVQSVQKEIDIPQLEFRQDGRCYCCAVSQVYIMERTVEIPQLQLAQTTVRSEIGRVTLDKTVEERDTLGQAGVMIVNEAARAWCIECLRYEIRDIIPPASMKQAVEMQAEAEHRKRAEILQSEGDQQSEINLARGNR